MSGGIARFADDLPAVSHWVSLGEGDTPVIELPRLAADLGLARLSAKMETVNPTGSYKDRVAAMSMSLALERGCSGWVATSSGNAGLAMATYGRRAGLDGCLCLVATAPVGKRAPLIPLRVNLLAVDGIGDQATAHAGAELMRQVQAAAEAHGLYVGITAHAFNPAGMRGVDTIGYELAQQTPGATCVYVPTGGGGLVVAVQRGVAVRGMATRVIACQPTGCAPIVRTLDGKIDIPVVDRCTSRISALQLPHPPDGSAAVEAVAASLGWGTAVSDEAIWDAQRRLATREGVVVEPAAATALAALIADVNAGTIGPQDDPVLLLTGSGWKDLTRFTSQAERIPIVDVADVGAQVAAWAHHART